MEVAVVDLQLFLNELDYSTPRTSQFPNATLNIDISPEYMGVGYVIGPRIAGTMFAGGVLSWLVLLPLLTILGAYITVPFPPIHPNFANNPATGMPFLISEMSAPQLWSAYIRYIGAGAVLAAGLITLGRTLPTIVASAREGLKDFGAGAGAAAVPPDRARHPDRWWCSSGSLALAVFLAVAPGMPTQGNFLASVLDHRVRLPVRDRLVAHHGPHRHLVESDFGDDDRHADSHVPALRRRWAGRATCTRPSPSASARSCASPPPTPAARRRI